MQGPFQDSGTRGLLNRVSTTGACSVIWCTHGPGRALRANVSGKLGRMHEQTY